MTLPGCQYIDWEAGEEDCCDRPAPYVLSEPGMPWMPEVPRTLTDLCEIHAALFRADFAAEAPHPTTTLRSRGMPADTAGATHDSQ
jgi:hypothetical protein